MPEDTWIGDAPGFPRQALQTDRLYFDQSVGQYFWTPDCVGVYWYESLAEARKDVPDQTVITIRELRDY